MEIDNNNKEWFTSWFNSPYYHTLYKNRDFIEAENFISNLFNFLKPSANSNILDVACGKGRHAIHMNKLGYKVDGFDLSENSIKAAQLFENDNLHFYVNDIRLPLKLNQYNYAFNLFTSFGYFSNEDENYQSIKSIADSLTINGVLILDFMNVNKVINNLISEEEKTIDGITFFITRGIKDNFIVKSIKFSDKGKSYEFSESVKAITLNDFKQYFKAANLTLTNIFGDYNLSDFNNDNSDRLIMIAKK
jgi:SAM-dependent methyltransferase